MRDLIDWHKQAVVAGITQRRKQGEGRERSEAGGASVEKRTETALGVTEVEQNVQGGECRAAISVPHSLLMMSSTPIPGSSTAGRPLQQLRPRTLATDRRGSTRRRPLRTGFWQTICLSLLLVLDELPPVLAESSTLGEAQTINDTVLPAITEDATCADWAAWIPRRSEPAVVMQVVSEGYIPIQQNFIRLIERNSSFNRHNLFLMCIDDASKSFFEEQMGIRCVPISTLNLPSHKHIWKLRVRVLSCLVRVGRVDVIMSDSDALWINDPTPELFQGKSSGDDGDGMSQSGDHNGRMLSALDAFGGSGDAAGRGEQLASGKRWVDIRDSDVVASRGTYPRLLGREWGSTMCMGFVLIRARNIAAMATFLRAVEDLVMETGDDQVSINSAAARFGIVWNKDSDMRYTQSTQYGVGEIPADNIAAAAVGYDANSSDIVAPVSGEGHEEVHPLTVTLLPHSRYTRVCGEIPVVSDQTVVAHCFAAKVARVKTSWMETLGLWSVENDP